MSLRRNIIANYASQIYTSVVAIVMIPMYIRYMGAEAYGLVGFFAMLQMWFQLLDMGLTPTMARESARFRGGEVGGVELRNLLRALEGIFLVLAMLGAAAVITGAGKIAGEWLQVSQLPHTEVTDAVILMALTVALRWISGLYRGTLSGFERLVWLAGFNGMIATVRFVLVIPFFIFVGTSPVQFFCFQLVVAACELAILMIQTYRTLPAIETGVRVSWQWKPLYGVLKFSLGVAFTGSVWVFVTQTDKLLLSRLLPLADYAYFTLAVLVASGVILICAPISLALQPRLTKLNAEGNEEELIRLYRNSTQLVSIIAVPAALILAFFPEQVLWAWTGDEEVARNAAPVLTLYALGNGILSLAAFPYYLQVAKGDLRLHLIGNVLFVLFLVPAMIWAVLHYGGRGAGYAWLGTNALIFAFWIPKVHKRFVQGLHTRWLTEDIGGIVLFTVFGAAVAKWCVVWGEGRVEVMAEFVMLGVGLVFLAAAGAPWIRETISAWRRVELRSYEK